MRVTRDVDELPGGLRFVATVGVFDGMHRGHLRVIDALTSSAKNLGATPLVVTFDPHPDAVVRGAAPPLLCDPAERLARLREAGVEVTVLQRFDEAFRQQSAEAFLERLRRGRDLAGLVMSTETAFGHDREGTVRIVRELAALEGWHLVEIPSFTIGGARVSSGRIRDVVGAGRLAEAMRLLGRSFAISGTVGGSALQSDRTPSVGFPEPFALPPAGTYAARITWGSRRSISVPSGGARDRVVPLLGDPLWPRAIADALLLVGRGPDGRRGDAAAVEFRLLSEPSGDGTALAGEHVRIQVVRRVETGRSASRRARAVLAATRDGRAVVREVTFSEPTREPAEQATTRRRFSGWWEPGRTQGVSRLEMPDDLTLDEALAWARARARRVELVLGADPARTVAYSAGDGRIARLPTWTGRVDALVRVGGAR